VHVLEKYEDGSLRCMPEELTDNRLEGTGAPLLRRKLEGRVSLTGPNAEQRSKERDGFPRRVRSLSQQRFELGEAYGIAIIGGQSGGP
jgi:hypothetical protein